MPKSYRKESKIQCFFFYNQPEGHRPQVFPAGCSGGIEAVFSLKTNTFPNR